MCDFAFDVAEAARNRLLPSPNTTSSAPSPLAETIPEPQESHETESKQGSPSVPPSAVATRSHGKPSKKTTRTGEKRVPTPISVSQSNSRPHVSSSWMASSKRGLFASRQPSRIPKPLARSQLPWQKLRVPHFPPPRTVEASVDQAEDHKTNPPSPPATPRGLRSRKQPDQNQSNSADEGFATLVPLGHQEEPLPTIKEDVPLILPTIKEDEPLIESSWSRATTPVVTVAIGEVPPQSGGTANASARHSPTQKLTAGPSPNKRKTRGPAHSTKNSRKRKNVKDLPEPSTIRQDSPDPTVAQLLVVIDGSGDRDVTTFITRHTELWAELQHQHQMGLVRSYRVLPWLRAVLVDVVRGVAGRGEEEWLRSLAPRSVMVTVSSQELLVWSERVKNVIDESDQSDHSDHTDRTDAGQSHGVSETRDGAIVGKWLVGTGESSEWNSTGCVWPVRAAGGLGVRQGEPEDILTKGPCTGCRIERTGNARGVTIGDLAGALHRLVEEQPPTSSVGCRNILIPVRVSDAQQIIALPLLMANLKTCCGVRVRFD